MNKDKIHLKAPGNWINDPNGFIFYKGKYHLFYQYFPYAPRWGTMHWGHAVSEDLVSWEHQGVALFPSRREDQNGCFSGSAVEKDGQMYLFYTGVRYEKPNPDNIHKCLDEQFVSSQMMISSEDGFHFDNFNGKRVIIPAISDRKLGDRTHTRDPKVWRGRDAWYMVLGSRTAENTGKLLFYRSENLTDWTWVNEISRDGGFGWMWECPDYFETEGGKVLLFSPMGFLEDGKKEKDQAICTVVGFEEETCTMMIPDEYQFLDYGLDLYAPQSTLDEKGRRVVAAWARMPEIVDGTWRGMFCIPRVVEVKDGHIYFRVHPNVEAQYTRRISSVKEADAAGFKISLDMEDGDLLDIGGYRIFRKGNRICTDRTAVMGNHSEYRMRFETPEFGEVCRVDIYVDRNLIEIFVNDGEYVLSNAVCGLKDELGGSCFKKAQLFTLQE